MTYRGFNRADLDLEYSPSSAIDAEIPEFIAKYRTQSAQARADLPVHENLHYGRSDSQVLDYFPNSKPNAPLHIFIHGGYWQQLSQRESASMAQSIVGDGYSFATLNYTIAPAGKVADMVQECRQALRWLLENALDLGFDPQKITVSGHSAGGHLAAMLFSGIEPFSGLDAQLECVILISGVFDLEPIRLTYVNEPLNLTKEDVAQLSPMQLTPTTNARIKVVVAENDTAEFNRQSRDYTNYLKTFGIDATFEMVPAHHHFDVILRPETFRG